MKRRLWLLLLLGLLLPANLSAQKVIELGVLAEWSGENCQYRSAKPFFLLRDYFATERFWSASNCEDAMPAIDFDKYMLLVWVPGPTLFDYQPATFERFFYQDGYYVAAMKIERKNSGGFWRRPFVAALLPSKNGDIHIMRIASEGSSSVYKHLYTIWDMSGERTHPFVTAKIETPPAVTEFISHSSSAEAKTEAEVAPSTQPVTQASESLSDTLGIVSSTKQQSSEINTSPAPSGFEDIFGSPQPETPKTKGASKSADVAATVAPPARQPGKPAFPAFAEDPLFGSEFDIEF